MNPLAIDPVSPSSVWQKKRQCILFLVTLLLLSGCSAFNCTRLEEYLGTNTDLINFSYSIADSLIARAMPPLAPQQPDMPILVTTLVDNNDLAQTSSFGRIIQENIGSRFVQLGYTVREVRLADALHVEPMSGETMLTRDFDRMRQEQQAQAVLVGTVSLTSRTLYISVRLVNPSNSNILATDDYTLCLNGEILSMFGLRRKGDDDIPIQEPRQPLLNSIL